MAAESEIMLFHVDVPEHKADVTNTISAVEFSILWSQTHIESVWQ